MYYVRHYCIHRYQNRGLEKILEEKYRIKCDLTFYPQSGWYTLIFDVPENHPQMAELEALLPEETPTGEDLDSDEESTFILCWAEYSEADRMNAEWLEVLSTFMNVIPVEELIDGEEKRNYKETCFLRFSEREHYPIYAHSVLMDPCVVSRPVKWRNKYFCSMDTDQSVLFCSEEARRILTENHVTGIEFQPVIKKSTRAPREDLYRLQSSYTISDKALLPLNNMESSLCPVCGQQRLRSLGQKSRYGVWKDSIDKNIDFCTTPPMFHFESGYNVFLISQRLYRILKENKMTRSLIFTPLETVDPADPNRGS